MDLVTNFQTLALTVRLNELVDESSKISRMIGDLPVVLFPIQHKKLIELAEEEYEIEIQLYELYITNRKFREAQLLAKAMEASEVSLYLLKTAV